MVSSGFEWAPSVRCPWLGAAQASPGNGSQTTTDGASCSPLRVLIMGAPMHCYLTWRTTGFIRRVVVNEVKWHLNSNRELTMGAPIRQHSIQLLQVWWSVGVEIPFYGSTHQKRHLLLSVQGDALVRSGSLPRANYRFNPGVLSYMQFVSGGDRCARCLV